jgi:hypothetical protein
MQGIGKGITVSESWILNSDHTEAAFIFNLKKLREKHGYITFSKPRIGKDRSIDQNSLFHVWVTEYAAHLLKKSKKEVTKGELAGMKFEIKKRFNHHHVNNFMVHTVSNPLTSESKKDYTSSGDWKRGEMYMVMDWLQLYAANDGLVLEARGVFAKLKREGEC